MAAFLSGLLKSFGDRAAAERESSRKLQADQDERELKILSTLSSSDDPEIANAAVTAMLDVASGAKKPKGGFLSRLMGPREVSTHPAVENLMTLIRTPRREEVPGSRVPITTMSFAPPPAMPGLGGAAMAPPPNAPGGGINPQMVQTPAGQGLPAQTVPPPPEMRGDGQPPSGYRDMVPVRHGTEGMSAVPTGRTTAGAFREVPRQVWKSAEQKMLDSSRAKAQGDVEGEVAGLVAAGFAEAEARELVKQKYAKAARGGATGFQAVAGQMPDGSLAYGTFDRATGRFLDPDTGQPLNGFQPRAQSSSTSFGADREAIAMATFGKRFGALSQPQQQQVMAEETRILQEEARSRALGTGVGNAQRPLSTQESFQATQQLATQWKQAEEPLREMQRQYRVMHAGLQRIDTDPIGAIEAVRVAFEKILDPTSVVREGEYNRQTNGLSALDRLYGWLQRQIEGGGNIPKERLVEMVNTAASFLQGMEGWNAALAERIDRQARQWGLDPANIRGGSLGVPPPPPPGGAGGGAPTAAAGGGSTQAGPPLPPGAPTRGSFVGNPYTGDPNEIKQAISNGREIFIGRVDGRAVEVVKGPDGKWYVR